ncbi:hypothetical protein K3495_g14594 [Podosphaera aphanis]|nr:hypothetical protein K3495_g14594 [Podosphaera aphanis]
MASPLLKSTTQACVISAISNLIAQYIKALRSNTPFTVNWDPLMQFILFTALNSPPNFMWQSYLETRFPSYCSSGSTPRVVVSDEKSADRLVNHSRKNHLSFSHTFIKFFLDQTLGACINTLLFSLFMAGYRGATYEEATAAAISEFWPIVIAGWKLWPAVSAFNFAIVQTVETRTLIGNLAGMAWNIYLSLLKS